jgi:hypothetical protein
MEQGKGASIQFVKKMNLTGSETEPCDNCDARSVCKLREQLHKVKIGPPNHYETHIVSCGLQIE